MKQWIRLGIVIGLAWGCGTDKKEEVKQETKAGLVATPPAPPAPAVEEPPKPALPAGFPAAWARQVTVLTPDDADYARASIDHAIQPAGKGGIVEGVVVRINADLPVYRLWNGPDKLDGQGRTNRMGQWWTPDAPMGNTEQYRRDYDICVDWNDLTWVATCTLKAGAVVAMGPGQSVSAETCGDITGQESYPANPAHWQVYVQSVWDRGAELSCPDVSSDYRADPQNLAVALASAN